MVTVTLNNILPSTVPLNGWIVGYKIKGSAGAYTVLPTHFFTQPIQFTTNDPAGTLYEGYIQSDCGNGNISTTYLWVTGCDCPFGYTVAPSGDFCVKEETQPATIFNSGYCLAPSTNGAYTNYESRIYAIPFNPLALGTNPLTASPDIVADLTASPYWANPASNGTDGPLNREGVWIDADCDGNKDGLVLGQQTTLAFTFNNVGAARTVYVGLAADNDFELKVNGTQIIDTIAIGQGLDLWFKIWHIIPVQLEVGANFFNLVTTGDGSVNDAMGMVIYDNTPAQLQAATSDAQLNILFASHSLRGQSYTVATCPTGWSLDTTGSNYICKKITDTTCNTQQSTTCNPISNLSTNNITQNSIDVSWTASPNASGGYIVEYKPTSSSTWQQTFTITGTSTTLTGLTSGTNYDIRVISLCANSNTSTSTPIQVTTSSNFSCGTSTITRNVNQGNLVTETWDMGCTSGSVSIEYNVNSIGANEKLLIEVLYNNVVLTSAANLVNGDNDFLVFNYNPISPNCSIQLRFTVTPI